MDASRVGHLSAIHAQLETDMAQAEARHDVSLTEEQIDAAIRALSQIRLGDVHLCRIKATHLALTELKEVKREIEIGRE